MASQPQSWNVITVVVDTLRTAYIGVYGNDWIHTPNMDRFAAEGVRFTHAHPECLPTIPTRRTLHGGRRAFPFRDYRPVPWDNVYLQGWQPLSPDEGAIAEALEGAGYHTGFYADCPHYFVPGMNFIRGFNQWEYIRGQAEDRYQAVARADPALTSRYMSRLEERVYAHLVNVRPDQPEEMWPTARVFRSAMQFLEDNAGSAAPFYLYVDSFAPHETWEAPLHYYDLYGTREEREPIPITVPYVSLDEALQYTDRLPSLRANYAGMVTMVDAWFGKLMDTVDRLGLRENTLVIFLSDHGTNFADNPDKVLGKPPDYMYPGTMSIPMMLRHPEGKGAGTVCDEFVYTTDVPATVMDATGAPFTDRLDGHSLLPVPEGTDGFPSREYLTCRYGNSVWYRDRQTWYFGTIEGDMHRLFDMETDPECRHDISAQAADRIEAARARIWEDADGDIEAYTPESPTDAVGRPV